MARYFTPAGHEIQARGVTPNLVVRPAISAGEDLQLREEDLANHLPPTEDTSKAEVQRAAPESSRLFGTRDDKALQAAVGLLSPVEKPGAALADILRKWTSLAKRRTATAGRSR